MSKYAKFTLLTLAAFLLLGFSITANAGKPDTNQLMTSAPLNAGSLYCLATNHTDADLEIIYTLYLDSETISRTNTVGPNQVIRITRGDRFEDGFCTVEWFGGAGDVRATFCTFSDDSFTYGAVCMELF